MTKVLLFRREKAAEGASIALKAALYVSGWQLSYKLQEIKERAAKDPARYDVAISMKDGTPVAVVIRDNTMLQAFCRAAERRNGYASACVRVIRNANPELVIAFHAVPGIDGSEHFWRMALVKITHWH